jgi:ribosomal protein S18 acetylase RimI-like enzyme
VLTRPAPQAAASLRADAFYEDMAERQALPFPKRFLPTFQREFAERVRSGRRRAHTCCLAHAAACARAGADARHAPARARARAQEIRSLELRTRGCVGASLACTCLVAVPLPSDAHATGHDHDELDAHRHEHDSHGARDSQYHTHAPGAAPGAALLLGCLDVSWKTGPCGSTINGVCVPDGEEYAYIDNVCVQPDARRAGVASALLDAASDAAVAYGAPIASCGGRRVRGAAPIVSIVCAWASTAVLTRPLCVCARFFARGALQARSRC